MSRPESRNTKRADRRALVDAGKRYNAAKLAYLYEIIDGENTTTWSARLDEYEEARAELVRISEEYAVGRRRASVQFGHKWYAKQKAKA